MATQAGRSLPPPPTENIHYPGEEGQTFPKGAPVLQIDFNKGVAWNGPTSRDLPRVPKPIQKTESISVPTRLPELESLSPDVNLNFIAKLLSNVFIQPRSFVTGQMTCGIANRGYQLPDIVVPGIQQVIIKAWFTNTGVIYVAHRQSDSQSTAVAWPLIANEGIGYRIPNVHDVWVMATVAGEGASYTVEQA